MGGKSVSVIMENVRFSHAFRKKAGGAHLLTSSHNPSKFGRSFKCSFGEIRSRKRENYGCLQTVSKGVSELATVNGVVQIRRHAATAA